MHKETIDSMVTASAALDEWRPVLEAVLEAGELLKADFNRVGGPEGTLHHAKCDVLAEELLRNRLLDFRPDYAYLGEETGASPCAPGEAHCWVVDPNDGTSAFMRGFRGAAVSVALLRNGVPVLGVVHACNWPNDEGSLVAWAEGGPVVRDGRAVQQGCSDSVSEQVVLVSQSADRNPEANLACVHPRRYQSMASIAWRLALVAAGEAVAGVSLAAPTSWDLAAGHALLLGAGLELFDDNGRAIRYTNDGRLVHPSTTLVIGGRPGVCRELLQRDWDTVMGRNRRLPVRWGLSWPQSGQTPRDPDRLARAQGCLLGQLCGDAFGSQAEFMSPEMIRSHYPHGLTEMHDSPVWKTLAGQPTDDSEMALALARMLLAKGGYESASALAAYRWWADSRPFDMGHTVSQGLRDQPVLASQANGALMRIAPLANWGAAGDEATLEAHARDDAALTHPHPVCQDVNTLFVRAIATAIRAPISPEALYECIREWAEEPSIADDVRACVTLAANEPPDMLEHTGWVLVAFGNALWHLASGNSLEQALIETVACGGDTDTNAAIAGALLGAVYGVDAIPVQWRRMVLSCRPLQGIPNVARPRPVDLWPVDALILAERLLVEGERQQESPHSPSPMPLRR